VKRVKSSILILLLVWGIASAQDPSDPYEPDTVYFCGVQSYVYGPPYSGRIQIDICFFNDEIVTGIGAYLVHQGPVVFDSVIFSNTRAESNNNSYEIASTDSVLFLLTPGPPFFYPGNGKLASLLCTVHHSGSLIVDTADNRPYGILFDQVNAAVFVPIFNRLEYTIKIDSIRPGDVNADGSVNLADVLKTAYYTFKRQEIDFKPAADVNSDCRITIVDVVYLVNYVLKSGPVPIPGCVWN
jgi:hypothetical protein